jgi:uncharacterized CHY-type Zn-finger protein
MKSLLQKQRELEARPVREITDLDFVKCPFCRQKLTRTNYNKYGKCYSCYMLKKIKEEKSKEINKELKK